MLVAAQGINLIKHAAWRTLERGGQFVLLGSAPDARVQAEFEALKEQLQMAYHDRAALVFSYDEPLSHLIYAGQGSLALLRLWPRDLAGNLATDGKLTIAVRGPCSHRSQAATCSWSHPSLSRAA